MQSLFRYLCPLGKCYGFSTMRYIVYVVGSCCYLIILEYLCVTYLLLNVSIKMHCVAGLGYIIRTSSDFILFL